MNNKERLQYPDIARGIAMICIVLGHMGYSQINRVVFTFHVPIFFLISGYFLKESVPFRQFIKRRVRTLVIPYFVICAGLIIAALVINQILKGGEGRREVFLRWFLAGVYGAGDGYEKPFVIYAIGAAWFLWATFWGSILLWILLRRPAAERLILIPIIAAISIRSSKVIWLPLSLQAGGTALLFMYFGYLGRELVPAVRKLGAEVRAALVIFAAWVWLGFIYRFEGFYLVHCNIGRGAADVFGSICACVCVLLISRQISRHTRFLSEGLACLGHYSLLMLSIHMLDWMHWDRIFMKLFHLSEGIPIILIRVGVTIAATVVFSRIRIVRALFGYEDLRKGSAPGE